MVGLLVGAACGLFNGFLVSVVKIPAILATLATFTLYAGIGTAIMFSAVPVIPASLRTRRPAEEGLSLLASL